MCLHYIYRSARIMRRARPVCESSHREPLGAPIAQDSVDVELSTKVLILRSPVQFTDNVAALSGRYHHDYVTATSLVR